MSEACKLCKGACCESVHVPINPSLRSYDFWETRGRIFSIKDVPYVELDSRCKHLETYGSCGIYPNRPTACKVFEVGSPGCLEAIKSRRPDQHDAIIALIK